MQCCYVLLWRWLWYSSRKRVGSYWTMTVACIHCSIITTIQCCSTNNESLYENTWRKEWELIMLQKSLEYTRRSFVELSHSWYQHKSKSRIYLSKRKETYRIPCIYLRGFNKCWFNASSWRKRKARSWREREAKTRETERKKKERKQKVAARALKAMDGLVYPLPFKYTSTSSLEYSVLGT